jgi:hypothetical protein
MRFHLIVILFCLLLIITGCRESAQPTVDPTPAKVGDATVLITITDAANNPVAVQSLTVRGDMTHAGMVPVMGAEAVKTDAGYSVPLTWSMGGDWIVTVEATLSDGRIISQEFDLSVES